MIRLARGRLWRLHVCAVLDDYGTLHAIRFGLSERSAEARTLKAAP